jgi:hypothetical protein
MLFDALASSFVEDSTKNQPPRPGGNKSKPKADPPSPIIHADSSFDLRAWILKYMPNAEGPSAWGDGGEIWVAPDCLFRPGDGPTMFIIRHANGGISAGCQHATCPGSKSTGNHWRELRERLEGIKRPARHTLSVHSESNLDEELSQFACTEFGLSDRFIARHGNHAKYIEAWDSWLVFDGSRWVQSQCAAELLAHDTILALLREAHFQKETHD